MDKSPHMRFSMGKYTYNVTGSISRLKSLLRRETVKFDKSHSRTTSKNHMRRGRLKTFKMRTPSRIT